MVQGQIQKQPEAGFALFAIPSASFQQITEA